MRKLLLATLLLATPAIAQDAPPPLNFDIAKLCEWQNKNNSMDVAECTGMESEAAVDAMVAKLGDKAIAQVTDLLNPESCDAMVGDILTKAGQTRCPC